MRPAPTLPRPAGPPALPEFIALLAMNSALVAFSIDAMLPALPEIAAELTPAALNRAQLVVGAFILGLGLGTLFSGPFSDAFGRRPVLIGGIALYLAAALWAARAQNLEALLAARFIQGLGASGPRVVTMAIVRDRYRGAQMARIMSYVMIVFSLVPAIAPLLGQTISSTWGWRAVFVAFMVFAGLIAGWFVLRQPETLPAERRRALSLRDIVAALGEILAHPTSRLAILVLMLASGMLFSTLTSVQQIFDRTYGRGQSFPLYFGAIAVLSTSAGFLNARLVERLGMRAMVRAMMGVQVALSALMLGAGFLLPAGDLSFALYLFWTLSLFFQAGLTIGNLNALALEPLGHIAGLASSVNTALGTTGAILIAVPLGLAYDGTARPLAAGVLGMAALAFWLTGRIRRPGEL